MQGRHPGSGRGSATNRIKSIVNEGRCRTFVCLQAESPPQDSESGVLGGFHDWKTNPMNFKSYREEVIAAIGSDTSGPPPAFVHYGIRNFDVADSLEGLSALIDDLGRRVRAGESLYMHCWGGKGRAGLVSACLLGELYDTIDAEEALQRVGAYVNLNGIQIHSPETDAQKDQVREFYAFRQRSRQ